jgi:hypothetical protein
MLYMYEFHQNKEQNKTKILEKMKIKSSQTKQNNKGIHVRQIKGG